MRSIPIERVRRIAALAATAIVLASGLAAADAHVCLQYGMSSAGSTYYDIRTNSAGTTMERYNMATNPPTLIDTNTYAALQQPPAGSMWGDGVAFAATMQTRSAWVNSEPNTAAYWDGSNGQDTWRFETVINGSPIELTFRTSQCQPFAHHVCLQSGSTFYDIHADASGTTLERYNTATNPPTLIDTNTYAALQQPAAGAMWGDGVAYAATMQTRNAWVNSEPNTAAYWDVSSGEDTWRFETTSGGAPTELSFRTSQCTLVSPPPPTSSGTPANCPSFGGFGGVSCTENEDCCGYDTISPLCIPKSGEQSCCVHFKSATSCNSTQTCCGSLGPGASSYAFCCDEGSSCCRAASSTQSAVCCPSGSTCCAGTGSGICCGPNEECVPEQNSCRSLLSTTTTSNAPAALSTPAPMSCSASSGCHHVCLDSGATYYEIRTDASGTTLDRYNTATNPPTFVDRNTYAALTQPAAGAMWGDGVAYAATMQTRSVWVNSEPNTAAYWDGSNGQDTWRFETTSGGSPIELTFRTSQCRPFAHHVCLQSGSTFYDIHADASGTTLERYNTATNPRTLIDTNTYAALQQPAAGAMWGDGVAYAATMQTRNAWVNADPNTAAYWDVSGGEDTWRFETTSGGSPTELSFRTSQCTQ